MLRCPTAFCRGAAKILLSSVRTAETILPTTVYMKECSCSLTEKNALRKEGFPVTSILPEMTDPSTGCRIRTSTDTSTWEKLLGIEMESDRRKVYVEVNVTHRPDGTARPNFIKFENDEKYEIDRVIQKCRAASTKVGGTGIRYTVQICGKPTFLFDEENGKWFVEAKS